MLVRILLWVLLIRVFLNKDEISCPIYKSNYEASYIIAEKMLFMMGGFLELKRYLITLVLVLCERFKFVIMMDF